MFKNAKPALAAIGLFFTAGFGSPLHAADAGLVRTTRGDIAFELVGQVLNPPMTPASYQYGYLSLVDGVDSIFTSIPHNETTARFTFFTRASTTQVIDNGSLRVVNRTGTTTIYLEDMPDGDFGAPHTFSNGAAILTMSLKQQVILDLAEMTFSTVNINTVTSAKPFSSGGKTVRLGVVGDKSRTVINGRVNDTGTPAGFVIAGYAVAIARFAP